MSPINLAHLHFKWQGASQIWLLLHVVVVVATCMLCLIIGISQINWIFTDSCSSTFECHIVGSRNNKSNENVSICSIKVVRPHFYSYVPSLVSKILEFFWLPTCISVWEMLMPTCGPCVPQQCIITQILDVICVSPLHTTIGFQRTKILGKRIDLNLTNGAQGQVGG